MLLRFLTLLLVIGTSAPGSPGGDPATMDGVIELVGGDRVVGALEIDNGELLVTPGIGQSRRVRLEAIASLDVRAAEDAATAPDPTGMAAPDGPLPEPWHHIDVGRMAVPGKVRADAGRFLIEAAPAAAGEDFPAFHTIYVPIDGDGEIVARVTQLNNADDGSYAGILMCNGLAPHAQKLLLSVSNGPDPRLSFRRWSYRGGNSTGKSDPLIRLPYWIKLARYGDDVSAYHSADGRRWSLLKRSPGKLKQDRLYVGLAARCGGLDGSAAVVFDHVNVNGVGSGPDDDAMSHLVLTAGSTLAAEIVRADGASFQLGGKWNDLRLTNPRVARIEFFHPLPADVADRLTGRDPGVVLRSGDFCEGKFVGLEDGTVKLSSPLFGPREFSLAGEVDALVLRKVSPALAAPAFRIETQAGSILLAQDAKLDAGHLVLEVAGIGQVVLTLTEVLSFSPLPAQAK